MALPAQPNIHHLCHVDRLSYIIANLELGRADYTDRQNIP